MEGRCFRVVGRVQGVGFRAFVLRLAAELGVSGEVWNCRDGSVEGRAYHESADSLERFVGRLSMGPGRVDSVHEVRCDAPEGADGFRIGETR